MSELKDIYYKFDNSVIYNTDNDKIIAKKININVRIYFDDVKFLYITQNNDFLCPICSFFPIKIKDEYYITMEKLNGYDLTEHIHNKLLNKNSIINIIRDVLSGLIYLNINNYIHCDIKPDNILIVNNNVKLIDYDMVTHKLSKTKTLKGTIGYIAPELFYNMMEDFTTEYTEKCDIWSLGMTLYHMIKSDFYYENDYKSESESENVNKYYEDLKNFSIKHLLEEVDKTHNTYEKHKTLLTKMLVYDEDLRLNANDLYYKYYDILKHTDN